MKSFPTHAFCKMRVPFAKFNKRGGASPDESEVARDLQARGSVIIA